VITNVIAEFPKRGIDLRRLDADRSFLILYAFYSASREQHWKEELFLRIGNFIRQRVGSGLDPGPPGADNRPIDTKYFVQTKWEVADRLEFLKTTVDILFHDGVSERNMLAILDQQVTAEVGEAVRSQRPLLAKLMQLYRTYPYHSALANISPEALLVFAAADMMESKPTADDLPRYDTESTECG